MHLDLVELPRSPCKWPISNEANQALCCHIGVEAIFSQINADEKPYL
jgi:hypothetical protein